MMKMLLNYLRRRFGPPPRLPASVPGPSPWYLGPHTPNVPDHKWVYAPGHQWTGTDSETPRVGKTVLRGPSGPVLIADSQHWISVIESSLLLIWHQPYVGQPPTRPVDIKVLDPARLNPMGEDTTALCARMEREGIPLLFDGVPVAEASLGTTVAERPIRLEFPAPLNRIEELLILCHSSGVDRSEYQRSGGLALLVALPAKSMYQLYGQDWFNNGEFDYGYEWVTRVARDPATGRIRGEGVRISPFALDDSLHEKAS